MDSSEGFVIVRQKRRKRRRVEEDEEDDFFEEEEEEEDVEVTFGYPEDTAKARKELYRKCLDTVHQSIDKLEDKWTCNNISQVIKFIDSASLLLNKKELVTPVAFVPSGLSFEENKQIFDKIMQEVMLETPMFCRISSTACPNVKIAFQTICKQLLQKTSNVSAIQDSRYTHQEDDSLEMETEDLEEEEEETKKGTNKYRYLSIHDLQQWYESKVPKYFENPMFRNSPGLGQNSSRFVRTPKTETPKRGRLLFSGRLCSTPRSAARGSIGLRSLKSPELIAVVIENADFFATDVLPQLLQLLSSSKLPFVFFIGISHCVSDFDRFLPPNCSSPFVFSTFQTVSALDLLNNAFREILDDDVVPIMLGPSVVHYLSNYFQSQHTSVKRLLQAYQICVLEHCRKPESIMCQFVLNSKGRCAVVKGPEKEAEDVRVNIRNWSFMFNFILIIQANLNGTSTTKLMKDLYVSCASGQFFKVSEDSHESPFDLFINEIKRLPKTALQNLIIKTGIDLGLEIGSEKDPNEGLLHKKSSAYVTKSSIPELIEELDNIKDAADKLLENEKAETQETSPKHIQKLKLRKQYASRAELQQQIKGSIVSSASSKSLFELRKSFVNFITNHVKTFMNSLKETLGSHYSAFVFDELYALKSLFSPDSQAYVTNSLMFPSKCLQCNCCAELGSSSIGPSLPDASILFKLVKEQTLKKIDLNRIFESFMAIVETEIDEGQASKRRAVKVPKRKKIDQDECLVRFRQAIAELQFVGALKRSKTNPDEINKLLWL